MAHFPFPIPHYFPFPIQHAPIGVFDSGIGGGTVLRELRRLLPAEDLLFLADQANCPYGGKSLACLIELSCANTEWLLAQGAKAIVVACNTASAAALTALRQRYSHVPFIGMVPAVKPAVQQTRSGIIAVLATPATIAGELLRDVIAACAGDVQVLTQPCPGLADQVEHAAFDTPETLALLERYIRPLCDAGADTLVLGCTHYPYLQKQIRALAGPHVTLIDPAPAIAQQTMRVLASRDLLRDPALSGKTCYATTGDPIALEALIVRLGLPSGKVGSLSKG